MDTTTSPPVVAKPSLGTTALDAWRAWRSLGWQGIPCYGNALGQGEFTWMRGADLHKVLDVYLTRPATESEVDEVWDCMLTGALRIYTRRNGIGVSRIPVAILHEMTGNPLPSGLSE
jgi:hypothetical protein